MILNLDFNTFLSTLEAVQNLFPNDTECVFVDVTYLDANTNALHVYHI